MWDGLKILMALRQFLWKTGITTNKEEKNKYYCLSFKNILQLFLIMIMCYNAKKKFPYIQLNSQNQSKTIIISVVACIVTSLCLSSTHMTDNSSVIGWGLHTVLRRSKVQTWTKLQAVKPVFAFFKKFATDWDY